MCIALLSLVALLAGSVSAATPASRTALLLTVEDMPPNFHVVRPARRVSAQAEARAFGVNAARFGRIEGVATGFKRAVTDFDDRALNEVGVSLIFFRSEKGARKAYKALAAKGRRLFAVDVGDESVGSGLTGPDVNVRWVWWRHRNVVATVVGSYFAGHPNTRSLIGLVREQQRRLAGDRR